MTIKIHSTKDVTANGAKIVIYGDSGVGKTTLLGDLDDLIIISAEKGLLSLADKDIPYITVSSLDDVNEAYNYVRKSKYLNIGVDSLSEIAESVLSVLIKEANKKAGKKTDPRPAYNDLAGALGALIRNFRDIDGKNIIFTAKEKPIYQDEDIIGYKPLMPGRVLPHGLPYLVDEVFSYQRDRKGNRFLQTEMDYKRVAKDRSGKLKAKELSPNLAEIISRILGEEQLSIKLP